MIYTDESTVKVDNVILPGLFKSLEIISEALIEEQNIEGSSKKPKQATGYGDAKILLELILQYGPEKTIIEKLEIIQNLFKSKGQSKPIVHQILNEHTAAIGISKVLFKKITSKRTQKYDEMIVMLEFEEYVPTTVEAIKVKTTKSTTTGKASANTPANTKLEPKAYSELDQKYKDYLSNRKLESTYDKKMRAYLSSRQVAPKIQDKTLKTAATDTANTSANIHKLKLLSL